MVSAVYNTKWGFRAGVLLIIAALLTLAAGITLICLHTASLAGASGVFAAIILIFTGALAVHVSGRRTKLKLIVLLSGALVSFCAAALCVSLSSLAIRTDCAAQNALPSNANKTMASCIVAMDVVLLLLALVDMIPVVALAYMAGSTVERIQTTLVHKSPQIVMLPVFPNSDNGNNTALSFEEQDEAIKIIENGLPEKPNESLVHFGTPLYISSGLNDSVNFVPHLPTKVTRTCSLNRMQEERYRYVAKEEEKRRKEDEKKRKLNEKKQKDEEKKKKKEEEKQKKKEEKERIQEEKKQKLEEERKRKEEEKLRAAEEAAAASIARAATPDIVIEEPSEIIESSIDGTVPTVQNSEVNTESTTADEPTNEEPKTEESGLEKSENDESKNEPTDAKESEEKTDTPEEAKEEQWDIIPSVDDKTEAADPEPVVNEIKEDAKLAEESASDAVEKVDTAVPEVAFSSPAVEAKVTAPDSPEKTVKFAEENVVAVSTDESKPLVSSEPASQDAGDGGIDNPAVEA